VGQAEPGDGEHYVWAADLAWKNSMMEVSVFHSTVVVEQAQASCALEQEDRNRVEECSISMKQQLTGDREPQAYCHRVERYGHSSNYGQ